MNSGVTRGFDLLEGPFRAKQTEGGTIMSEHNNASDNLKLVRHGRRATVALVAAIAMFGAASALSLTACKQEQGNEMSAPSSNDIPHGCSPATTPCQ